MRNSVVKSLFKSSETEAEVLPSQPKLTLDDAYEIASRHGKVEIGGVLGVHQASITITDIRSHYINLKCNRYPSVIQNLAECISEAERLRNAFE